MIYSGTAQYFMVPSGVTLLDVSLTGASGGSGLRGPWSLATANGGRGSIISCTIPVIPGDTYQVNIGGTGEYAGAAGWNGGGTGGRCIESGGGGGSTDLRNGSYDITDRLVVAGGGGGGESYGSAKGGDGGYPEGSRGDDSKDIADGVFPGGGGGSQTAGGFTSIAGLSGRLFYGSDETPFYNCLVGGGGGGYYGGGAAKYAGGGGGSSYCVTSITKNTISPERNANGKVVIRYIYPGTSTPSATPSSSVPSMEPPSSVPSMEPSSRVPSMEPPSSVPSMEPSSSVHNMEPSSSVPSMEPSSSVPSMEPYLSTPTSPSSKSKHPHAGNIIDKPTSHEHLDESSSFRPSTSPSSAASNLHTSSTLGPTPNDMPPLLSTSAAPSKASHQYRTSHPTSLSSHSHPIANSTATMAPSTLLPSTITTSVPSTFVPSPLSPAPTSSRPKLDVLSTFSLYGLVVLYFTALITFMYIIFPFILGVTV